MLANHFGSSALGCLRLHSARASANWRMNVSGILGPERRCTNRCTKSFRPCPISPTVAGYCRRIRLIPLSPASELPTVTAEVASSSLVVPAILSKELASVPAKPLRTQPSPPCSLITVRASLPSCSPAKFECRRWSICASYCTSSWASSSRKKSHYNDPPPSR